MYKYHFRPGYGSEKLLIEIFIGLEKEEFLSDLLDAIKILKPEVIDFEDLWMNDEISINVNSEMGEFIVSKDTWGFVFLMSENNQECLFLINSILEIAENFEKVEIDFENYKL
ncbi:hypothetical protein M2306_001782 [Myroides gitamensis]|uniref:hypothetical protein n=1 Tax=Myroides odoratus TaxID=256 RepID=UPI002168F1B6|nr:hypothetical protein [Myroides odoratus]MCS4240161.1 hypothetical protein [Myroides odoratus]MDH6601088.1 hypothetical protein [Myroides gitamensis]